MIERIKATMLTEFAKSNISLSERDKAIIGICANSALIELISETNRQRTEFVRDLDDLRKGMRF